mgnify:CR=1 FL=1
MPRTHVIQSWVGAAEYDEGDTYSGEQIGNRNQRSVGVAFERSGDGWSARKLPDVWTADGKANIKAFSDEALGLAQKKTPSKKTVPIAHQIVPQEKTLDRLDKQEAELYKAFENEEISEGEFKQLIFALEQKRHRAWKSRCKALGIAADAEEDEEMLPEWQDRSETVGKNNVEKRDWWEGGNVFILTHKKLKDVVKSALNKKLSVDKEKLSPYIGGVVLSFITFVVLF